MKNDKAYRGMGRNVRGMGLVPALETSGLDWKTVPRPVLVEGVRENRKAKGYQALLRSDNGLVLDITSTQYKPVHNAEVLGLFQDMAAEVGLEVTHAGALDEGRRVFAVANGWAARFEMLGPMEGRGHDFTPGAGAGEAKVGDVVSLKFVLGTGHFAGAALTVDAIAERLVCTNGATVDVGGRFSMTHRNQFGVEQRARLREMVARASEGFKRYEDRARMLRGTGMTREEMELFVIELLQPSLLETIMAGNLVAVAGRPETSSPRAQGEGEPMHEVGRRALDAILSRDERVLTEEVVGQYNRPVRRVIEAIDEQPGAEMGEGTAWQAYNAVTYYVDHVRGRSDDSGMTAALYGDGRKLKNQALELAVEYTERKRG